MELKNKVVVITGASKGLGKAMAKVFAQEGAKLILCSRSQKELEKSSREIGAAFFVADVTDEKQLFALADFAIKKFQRIDIWINNAGIWVPHAPIERQDSQRVHEMVEVNLFGTIHGSKAALIVMRKQYFGTIINILSTSALNGRAGSAGYCASKYGATGFTKSLRLEARPENITVFSIYPGGMQTNFFDERKPENFNEFMNPSFVAQKIVDNLKKNNPKEELIIKRE